MTDAADVDFAAATKALAARERILQALGPLAASPLDEDATMRMSQALRQASTPEIRAAVRRLESSPPVAGLTVVSCPDEGGNSKPIPITSETGGAA